MSQHASFDAAARAAWAADLVPAHLRDLQSYQPGKPIEELERELGITGAIKVASNENPLGPSPAALAAIAAELPRLHLYPDASGHVLRAALSAHLGVGADHIILGAGSNELLYQLVLALCEPDDEVVSHQYAFLSYRLAALVAGRRFIAAPASAALGCDVDALIAAFTPRTKLVVLGTPNNPTGTVLTRAELERVRAALPTRAVLVVDEAYAEYAAAWPEVDHADGLAAAAADPRIVVLRTFSKIYGLAGLRVGYGVADPAVVDLLGRVTRTFNVGTLAQIAATAALADRAHVAASAAHARRCLEALTSGLAGVGAGVRVLPSLANFALVACGRPSAPLYDQLLRQGVIVRPMAAWGLPAHLRVSVASTAEQPRVIATLARVLAG
ncbi:MAG: histidinol-phosphate transaminase [Kofleriaceae bacterium]|jgi:histidinol-phosphate aminotransferase|nr:histidinol-phosphate transaminase [Kofleriaceae bacterium]MBP6835953.1 histidinol-phosphate transaminase [Kofleriaceae bacterium]